MKFLFPLLFFAISTLFGQSTTYLLKGKVTDSKTGQPLSDAQIEHNQTGKPYFTDKQGNYSFSIVKSGMLEIKCKKLGYVSQQTTLQIEKEENVVDFVLVEQVEEITEVEVFSRQEAEFGITRLKSIEGTTINESKKTEVIVMKNMVANTATNNPRQIYAKIPGLNIWENDAAGLQLSIGSRGLSPNRTSNFNIRQNGYDISADPIGYPESYYTPTTEALEKIEIIRGAASLQYGPQFGGMVNFVVKKGPKDKPIEVTTKQTIGSFGLFNSFNSIGGTKGKFNYYTFFQHKRGDGWRRNSQFEINTYFLNGNYQVNENIKIGVDFTYSNNLSKQPGGLNDNYFEEDPRQSRRDRNWFLYKTLMAATYIDIKLGKNTNFNSRFFYNNAERISLGILTQIQRDEVLTANRTVIWDNFENIGNETRLLHKYQFLKTKSAFLIGFRAFQGKTFSRQGDGNASYDPDFKFNNPTNPENLYYNYTSQNLALFSENVFFISPKFSVTPGFRFESIQTQADGYYKFRVLDMNGALVAESKYPEYKRYPRHFLLLGIGTSYKPNDKVEFYGNISQNYRAITFNDIRVVNPSTKINPNIRDERGYNADIGVRGSLEKYFNFDISVFYLSYKDRIGNILQKDSSTQFIDIRYQTNISDSRSVGIEAFGELDFFRLIKGIPEKASLSYFINVTLNDTRYINSDNAFVRDKMVEEVPAYTFRNGFTFRYNKFSASLIGAFVGSQYADATNAKTSKASYDSGILGEVPAYFVSDLSLQYNWRKWNIETGVNNLTNSIYFTRRAKSYPGPGIITSDPRSFYLKLGLQF